MKRQIWFVQNDGFTFVQLMVTLAVVSVLFTIACLQFQRFSLKNSIEKQQKMLYADMMDIRLQSLFEKNPRAVSFTATEFSVFPGIDTSVAPVAKRRLLHPVTWSSSGSSLVLRFDTYGISNKAVTVCVDPSRENPAAEDCLVISKTRLRLGKRAEGQGCDPQYVASR